MSADTHQLNTAISDASRPRLAPGVRLQRDRVSGGFVLLFPEALVELTGSGAEIVSLCDGTRSIAIIADELSKQFNQSIAIIRSDAFKYVSRLRERMLLVMDGHCDPDGGLWSIPSEQIRVPGTYRPMGLIAELTYHCPLHCPYCSNPTSLRGGGHELETKHWQRVLREAADIGVFHASFSGGEPLARRDLEELITHARKAGLYTNLITSGLGLTESRGRSLRSAGLDAVQVSFQSDESDLADAIAGESAHTRKLKAACIVREVGLPLTLNAVLHRANIDRLDAIVALAERLDARRIELASAQYYGWAAKNRAALLPSRAQVDAAARRASLARERLRGKIDVLYVLPDYFGDRPKPCMNGWGQKYISVNPVGDVLPCPTAGEIRSLTFDNVRDRSLGWIWEHSPAFNRFRGTGWMPAPCRTCENREIDFGGCRCQAALITGDPTNTDPVCSRSSNHHLVQAALQPTPSADSASRTENDWIYRNSPAIREVDSSDVRARR